MSDSDIENTVNNLRTILQDLPDKSKGFASSLVANYDNKGRLSAKQLYWVEKIYNDHTGTKTVSHALAEPREIAILRTYGHLVGATKWKSAKQNQSFVASLVDGWDSRGRISDKQMKWVNTFVDQINKQIGQIPVEDGVGGFEAVVELVNRAGDTGTRKLKVPSVNLFFDDREYVIRAYDSNRNEPKTDNLMVEEVWRSEGVAKSKIRRSPLGYISPSGNYHHSRNTSQSFVDEMRDFATDPIAKLAEMGKIAGKCTFCRRGLHDHRSTAHGYGPVCAKNYRLPWNNQTAQPIIQKIEHIVNMKAIELRPGVWAQIDLETNTIVQTFDSYAKAQASVDEWSKLEHHDAPIEW